MSFEIMAPSSDETIANASAVLTAQKVQLNQHVSVTNRFNRASAGPWQLF
jgi:hypothetical protein